MMMEEDRIERDVDDIARVGADLRSARERELALGEEEARIASEIAALEARRCALEAERRTLHDREVADERRIAADTRDIADALGDTGGAPPPPASATYGFFVDGKPYETDQPRLTGMQIKAKVHDWDATHDLVLEGIGGAADQVVADVTEVDFAAAPGPLHFSSCPKATFGQRR